MMEIGKMIKDMDMEYLEIMLGKYIKDNGIMIVITDRDL